MVYTELAPRCSTSHATPKSAISTPLPWILKMRAIEGYSHSFGITRNMCVVSLPEGREQRCIKAMNNNLSSSFSLSPSAFRLLSLFRRLVFVCFCCCCCLSVSHTCKHGHACVHALKAHFKCCDVRTTGRKLVSTDWPKHEDTQTIATGMG